MPAPSRLGRTITLSRTLQKSLLPNSYELPSVRSQAPLDLCFESHPNRCTAGRYTLAQAANGALTTEQAAHQDPCTHKNYRLILGSAAQVVVSTT